MANAKFYSVGEAQMHGTVGTWALDLASNVFSYKHTDGNDTSVVAITIPKGEFGQNVQNAPSIIKVPYTLTTADLDAAPTAVLNKLTWSSSTGVVTRSAVTQTLTFAGVDTTGTAAGAGAAGTHIAVVTITTPENLGEDEAYVLELTLNAAATTVLNIQGLSVSYV